MNRYAYVRNNPLRYTDPSGHKFVQPESSTCGIHDDRPSGYDLSGMRPPDKIDATARGDSYGRQLNQALHYCASFGCDPAVVEGLQHEYQPFLLRDPELGQEQAYLMAVASGPELVTGLISFGISFINPFEVRFSQDSISYHFKDTRFGTIDDLAEGLRTGKVDPSDIPAIRIVEIDGK